MPCARISMPSTNRFPHQPPLQQLRQRLRQCPQQQLFKVPLHKRSFKLISGQIQVGLTSLSRTIDDYDNMAKREIISAKQEKALQSQSPFYGQTNVRRVKDFRAELLSLRTKFDSLKRLHSESVLTANRAELFGRRGFQSATPENPYDTSRIRTNSGLTREQGMLREHDFLRRTDGQLDDFIGRGMAVLDNLVEQRGFLKVSIALMSMYSCT